MHIFMRVGWIFLFHHPDMVHEIDWLCGMISVILVEERL